MRTPRVKVGVIGCWHLGSVFSACLADLGYLVVGADRDAEAIAALQDGIPPVSEPGLPDLIRRNRRRGSLSYSTTIEDAVREADYVIIAYDTPVDDDDEADLTQVLEAASEMAPCLEGGATVIVSSQAPVGTCERIRSLIAERNPAADFDVACSPENLRLGEAIQVFKHPERIVIGAERRDTHRKAERLFAPLGAPTLRMNLRTAEMVKHALNAFLATSISFANEIAGLCDELGVDALEVARALRADSRIGEKARLAPGLGFAGGTLARDLKALASLGGELGVPTRLVDSVLEVNRQQNGLVVRKLKKAGGPLPGRRVAILGLTYKAGTSTLRRSVALEIARSLTAEGAAVRAYDPGVDPADLQTHDGLSFCADPGEAVTGADSVVIATAWPEFRHLDFRRLGALMTSPVMIDTQNMLDRTALECAGFTYFGVGRGR